MRLVVRLRRVEQNRNSCRELKLVLALWASKLVLYLLELPLDIVCYACYGGLGANPKP